MLPITLAIVARDEADRIGRALASVPFAAERLVLDSGSRDGTAELAESLGARVLRTDWPGHVAQKNRALRAASQPWVLFLDADEWLDPRAARAVGEALASEPAVAGFRLRRRNRYLGRWLRGGDFGPSWHLRLVRRDAARWGGTDPHDRLCVAGRVASLPGFIEHEPYRSLSEHLRTLDRYSARWAELSPGPVRPWDLALRPAWAFLRGYLLRGGFRDGTRGLLVAGLASTYVLLKWSRRALAGEPARPPVDPARPSVDPGERP